MKEFNLENVSRQDLEMAKKIDDWGKKLLNLKCDASVLRVNEYSSISAEFVSQMVSVDFPVHYNCIRVEFSTDSEHLEFLVESFVSYCENKFSVFLIQRVGIRDALFNVFTFKNMSYIYRVLFDFERYTEFDFDFSMRY